MTQRVRNLDVDAQPPKLEVALHAAAYSYICCLVYIQTDLLSSAVYVCLPVVLFVFSSEAPEEEYDPRSLFERLQEQKDKKQEEFEEQFKFSESVSLC